MDRALLHSDGCYKIPHVRAVGHVCKTNTASNTAFRGFGGPQANPAPTLLMPLAIEQQSASHMDWRLLELPL